MDRELVDVFLLALLAACYPTLIAAVTVMLVLPNPKQLMFGFLLGAYTTSITVGLVIVFSLEGSRVVSTSRSTISPAQDIAVGLVLLIVAWVLASGRSEPLRRRWRRRKEAKEAGGETKEPRSQRMLGRGSARITYAVGAMLSFPGVSYLAALKHMAALDAGTAATVLLVVGFCLIELLLLELPLLGYALAPERTHKAVGQFRDWLGRSGGRIVIIGTAALGTVLVARGLIGLS